jgi:ABC-type lipoprotein release transport system permease subunit
MLALGTDLFAVRPVLALATVVCAPVVTVLASYWPTWIAVRQDPAIVLMDN